MLTTKQMKLAAALLRLAADEFSNHGCNDMDQAILREIGFTEAEKQEMADEYASWNGDRDYEPRFSWIGDSSWMSFLAEKLTQAANEQDAVR